LNGSSKEAVKEWIINCKFFSMSLMESPLATERNMWARLVDIYIKFAGMHADHWYKEKKNFCSYEREKNSSNRANTWRKANCG